VGRVLVRKTLLVLILVPLLNLLGYYYAISVAPTGVRERYVFSDIQTDRQPFSIAYPEYVSNLLRGEFGRVGNQPIDRVIGPWFFNTLALLGIALALTIVGGPLLGIGAISPRTSRIRPAAQTLLTIGSTLPGFFLGSLLIVIVLYISRLGLYQGRGTIIPIQGFGLGTHLILPVITLAARPILYVGYLTAGLLETELQQDYIRVARSKGLSWAALLWRHALPNIVASVVVALGQSLRVLASGLILVEALFDWRGVGRLFLNVVQLSEGGGGGFYFLNPSLLALIVMFFGALLLLADLLATTIAAIADPRLRSSAQAAT
jgi:ABC-type dipeptide/oligopeptide/nickel transport system permease component